MITLERTAAMDFKTKGGAQAIRQSTSTYICLGCGVHLWGWEKMSQHECPRGPYSKVAGAQWHCRYCGYGEYVNGETERAVQRKADHEAQCNKRPQGEGGAGASDPHIK